MAERRESYTQCIDGGRAEKLFKADKSLSTQQLEGVGFIIAGVVPKWLIYEHSTDSRPCLITCLKALERHRDTQACASFIFLTALDHVGCGRQHVEELRTLLGTSDPNLISLIQKTELSLRRLLYDICQSIPGDDQRSLIHLSEWYLDPPKDTNSLFVHLGELIEQKVITPSDLKVLYHCLAIMGKQTVMDKIRKYCENNNCEVPYDEIVRVDLSNISSAVSLQSRQRNVSGVSGVSGQSDQRSGSTNGAVSRQNSQIYGSGRVAQETRNVSGLSAQDQPSGTPVLPPFPPIDEGSVPRDLVQEGGPSPDRRQTVNKDGDLKNLDGPVEADRVAAETQMAVKTDRFKVDALYINWTSPNNCKNFRVIITAQDNKQRKAYNTSHTELVISKVVPEKGYRVTVEGLSGEGECLERQTVEVHLLEKVIGVDVTDATTHGFNMKWNKPVHREVRRYCIECETKDDSNIQILKYYVSAAEVERDGEGVLSATFDNLQLNSGVRYGVRVASVYENGEIGPFSESVEISTQTEETRVERKRTHSIKDCCNNRRVCWCTVVVSVLFTIFVSFGASLAIYNSVNLKSTTKMLQIPDNTLYPLYTADLFFVSKIRITSVDSTQSESTEVIQLFTAPSGCNSPSIFTTEPYEVDWNMTSSDEQTFKVTNASGLFGPGSAVTIWTNITATESFIGTCEAALFIFDDNATFIDFLGSNRNKDMFVPYRKFCFNVSKNGLSHNFPQRLLIEDAVFLYFGMCLPKGNNILLNAELRLNGSVNLYNQSSLMEECTILLNGDNTCEIILATGLQSVESEERCILALSPSKQATLKLEIFSSFPQNYINIILLVLTIVFFLLFILFFLICIKCYYSFFH